MSHHCSWFTLLSVTRPVPPVVVDLPSLCLPFSLHPWKFRLFVVEFRTGKATHRNNRPLLIRWTPSSQRWRGFTSISINKIFWYYPELTLTQTLYPLRVFRSLPITVPPSPKVFRKPLFTKSQHHRINISVK